MCMSSKRFQGSKSKTGANKWYNAFSFYPFIHLYHIKYWSVRVTAVVTVPFPCAWCCWCWCFGSRSDPLLLCLDTSGHKSSLTWDKTTVGTLTVYFDTLVKKRNSPNIYIKSVHRDHVFWCHHLIFIVTEP